MSTKIEQNSSGMPDRDSALGLLHRPKGGDLESLLPKHKVRTRFDRQARNLRREGYKVQRKSRLSYSPINAQNSAGDTALHIAARFANLSEMLGLISARSRSLYP